LKSTDFNAAHENVQGAPMKYPVWFVRLIFAAWMIPSGLNHFIQIFPQPMGSQPLSQELIIALLDSNLFDLVKAVELIAGLGLLLGLYTSLSLLICLPVSFCVFYWDAPLEGWGSRAAIFGYSVLLCNSLLCLAYYKSYSSMFILRATVGERKLLVLGGRLLLGAWMLLNGANYLFFSFWSIPMGNEPLALQLMTSLVNSRLLDVAMAIQLLTGALILAGIMVPVALCTLMPISTCALYWALILNQQQINIIMALAVFALNGLLMLAYLSYYQGTLQRHALAIGEEVNTRTNFDDLFVNLKNSAAKAQFIPAIIPVIAAIVFYDYLVGGGTADYCLLFLMYPLFTLLTGRIRDMGFSPAFLLAPLVLILVYFGIRLDYFSLGDTLNSVTTWSALILTAGFVLWGSIHAGNSAPTTEEVA